MRVELYFDIVCPYAYLGSTQIERIAERHGATVAWKPFLLGGVFRALGVADDATAAMSAAKQRHNLLDMHRWADHFGVPLEMPAAHPRRTVLALRALLAAGEAGRASATHALFDAYWVRGEDVADPDVVAAAFERAGLDGRACVEAASTIQIKQGLRERTEEAVRRGVFGAPTMFVGDAMFWGQDRLDFVEAALAHG
jgi:2-hydroxychromene-2-carboxylate isomerase